MTVGRCDMNLPDFYYLEVEGISKTIRSYTVENYIKSYSKQLLDLSILHDRERITVIVNRLIKWYEEHLDVITESRFVLNKEEHIKSYHILIELQDKLTSNI